MRTISIIALCAGLAGCGLDDRFKGAVADDMAVLGDDMAGYDMAGPPGSDLSGPNDMAPRVPQWTRHAMVATSGGFYNPGPIWGSSATDLYTVAVDSTTMQASIWHSTDTVNWTEQFSVGTGTSPGTISGLWGSGLHDIWAVGSKHLLHSTGAGTWTDDSFLLPANVVADSLTGVWGSGLNDVYITGAINNSTHMNGILHITTTASFQPIADAVSPIWGSGPTDIYVASSIFYRTDHSIGNGSWQTQVANSSNINFTSIWGSGPNDIYAIGATPVSGTTATEGVFHSTGNGDWGTPQIANSSASLDGPLYFMVYGTGPNDIYVSAPLLHSTGDGNWKSVDVVNNTKDIIHGMWAASPTQIFATAAAHDGINSPVIWTYQ
jgi:hypothetical protein